jgi:hypothetical protein
MVERVATRGAHLGEKFLGCRAYPQCRGTRPLLESPPQPSPDAALDRALDRDVAGASARTTYERRHEAHAAWQRSIRGRVLVPAGIGVVVGLAWWSSGQRIGPFLSIFGLYLAILSALWAVGLLIVTPQSIRAWQTGARGEEKTAAWLNRLPFG